MILANVTFGSCRKSDPDQFEDVAENYLATLLHSGQLCGDHFLTWRRGRLNAHVLLAGRSAAEQRYHSRHGKKQLKKVIATFGVEPVWRILDDAVRRRPSSWRGAPFLYLFTHAFDLASPVCRGDGKPSIPVCMLPMAFEHKDRLYFWQRSYYHLDNIWLGSGALEIEAYRQLADPDSELAKHGRDLCREIEEVTGVPTFYYLTRYWGRFKGEEQRLCPGCGATWKADLPPESRRQFLDFDFKCDHCRLVSHIGVSTDDWRHARIGEFDKKTANHPAAGNAGRALRLAIEHHRPGVPEPGR